MELGLTPLRLEDYYTGSHRQLELYLPPVLSGPGRLGLQM
mgnify:CR=1 FL=1